MKLRSRLFAGVAVSAVTFSVFAASPANASPVECKWDGVPVIVAIGGAPVIFVCGDGNVVTNTNTVDPSIQFDPHLLTPAPEGTP